MSKFSLKYVKVVIYRCGDPKLSHTHLDQELDFLYCVCEFGGWGGKGKCKWGREGVILITCHVGEGKEFIHLSLVCEFRRMKGKEMDFYS